MRRRVVCDSSVVVALLLDAGPDGSWAADAVNGADVAVPSLFRFEAANIIRRHELARLVTPDQAAQAHADLLDLPVEQWPYETYAPRAWQLRRNLTTYDASYVALAELLDIDLVSLDRGISRAPTVRCRVLTP